jgi:hypothetical protein
MDYDAIVAQVLALLQQETGEQCGWGVSRKRQAKESPAEHIPTMPDVCSNPLGMKSFHGIWAGNVHECLLK